MILKSFAEKLGKKVTATSIKSLEVRGFFVQSSFDR